MTIQTHRAKIRHYISTLLQNKVDIGNKVFTNNPSILFSEQLPAICISYGDRENEVRAGTKYHSKTSLKKQTIVITIAIEDCYESGIDINLKSKSEDQLDYFSEQVEKAISEDWNLAKSLEGYDANDNWTNGLVIGNALQGDSTYEELDGERKLLFRSIRYVFTYETFDYPDFVFNNFEEYFIDIQGAQSEGSVSTPIMGNSFTLNFDYTDFEGSKLIGIIPSNKYAAFVIVIVDSVFDDLASVTVGDPANNERLQRAEDNDILYLNSFMTIPTYKYNSVTELYLYLSGSPTQGSGRVVVYYY